MSALSRRFNTVQRVVSSNLQPAASYTVTAYAHGGVIETASSGFALTTDSPHGFASGEKIMVGTDEAKFRTITSITSATAFVVGSAVSVVVGDLVVNLGADTGSTSPNYDGSSLTIYSDADGEVAISQSRVTTNSQGEYSYWHRNRSMWELVRDAAGDPIEGI